MRKPHPSKLTFTVIGTYATPKPASDCLQQTVDVHPDARQIQFTVENHSTYDFLPVVMRLDGKTRKEFVRIISIAVGRKEQLDPAQILDSNETLGKCIKLPALQRGQGITILFQR